MQYGKVRGINYYRFFFCFFFRMNKLQLSATFFYLIVFVNATGWMACPELSVALRLPCKCQMEIGIGGQKNSVEMDCDRIVFTSDTPQIPLGAPITTFTQRYAGQQALPSQVIRRRNVMMTTWPMHWLVKHKTFSFTVGKRLIICKIVRWISHFHLMFFCSRKVMTAPKTNRRAIGCRFLFITLICLRFKKLNVKLSVTVTVTSNKFFCRERKSIIIFLW